MIPQILGFLGGYLMSLTHRYKCYGVNSNIEVTTAIETATQLFSYGANKDDLRNLLKETAIAESNYGNALYDPNRNFGRGLFQFDKIGMKQALQVLATKQNGDLKTKLIDIYPYSLSVENIDKIYKEFTQRAVLQAILCRFYYLGVAEAIPNTLEGRARYWKKYYNSEKGAGTPEAYISRVKNFYNKG